ncbi:NAD(P)-dependent alcohol dehydrogenase [uncultured Fibrella sp.]|uniref:NAD(P)-dependent alcohol dehydrogenase n=1 Tax=uncultured Fibrella sp. TaxID=1284596 RepID=UPI0035CC6D3C
MIAAKGYAAQNAKAPLAPFQFERRDLKPHDVQFDIHFCGVCHSDIHQVRDEWGGSIYPMVPGHEIVGRVTAVGDHVTKFKVGDLAGVGCIVDSCRHCESCEQGLEQYCLNGNSQTYNGREQDKKTPTYGGYSNLIITHEDFVFHIPESLDLAAVAPLLCAGITTYSPLKYWKVGPGHKVAVLGLGGLGHMAVKFAVAFGAEVTMLSTSASKEEDAKRLGAHKFVLTKDADQVKAVKGYFDFIIDTVSAPHDYNMYLGLLKVNGVHICVGAPPTPAEIGVFNLLGSRKSLVGSNTGGMPETQEMLNYCGEHNIVSDIELIPMSEIDTAYERMLKGDVRYRFVIDMSTL